MMEDETVWLTQAQIVDLFQSSKGNISEHIKNIYEQQELEKDATVRNFRTVRIEGGRKVARRIAYYNLDAIVSIGFRVNTKKGIQFRQWANKVLKEYLLKGYAINQRIERLEQRVSSTEAKVDFFVKTSLPPVQGLFYDGQIFDAYTTISNLIKQARRTVVLIDNYIDETTLTLLDKRAQGVDACIYTHPLNNKQELDIQKHNSQYPPISVIICQQVHDRFLIIDDTVYLFGASIKDAGKKLFAYIQMSEISVKELIKHLK